MSDLIRREDAIEVAYQLRHKPNDDEWNDEWLRSLNAIPTIDAVSVVWIPCSERLPKRQGYYICTCKDGSKYKRTTVVKWSNGWQLTGARAYWVVLAWMPLPKPYGERSDNGEDIQSTDE